MTWRGKPSEIDFFRELWTDTGGRPGQGRMVFTIARRLGIQVSDAEELAERTAKLGLIELNFGSVSVSYAGWKRVKEEEEKAARREAAAPPDQPPSYRTTAQPRENAQLPRKGRPSAKPRVSGRGRRSPSHC